MNIFDLTLRLKGFPIREAKKRLSHTRSISEEDFKTYQERLKKDIFEYHLRENPFYKNLVGAAKIDRWEAIPVLTKKEFQLPLQQRLSNGFTLNNCYQGRTSGSSGIPLSYAKDTFCHAMTWAHIMERFGWYGIDFNNSYQARFYGIPLDFKTNTKEKIKDVFANRYRFSIFDLSEAKLEGFLKVFKKKRFDFINGHTSSIVLFAKFLQRKKIVLTEVSPTLKTCIVTSEMLYDDDKILLEQQLGVPIVNEYGASEIDLLAFTNLHGQMAMNSDTVFAEILDNDDKVLPYGTAGRVVITALFNKAHPFIRYDIGDIGIMDPTSTAKHPVLKQLIGRSNDNAKLANGTTVPGHTFYYVTKTALGTESPITEFVLVQNALDTFTIKYVADRSISEKEIRSLHTTMQQYLKTFVHVKHERVNSLDRTRNGKLKQFVSLLS